MPTLRLEAIEVTQAIQDLDHSVPLVANKATIVRVYLSSPGGSIPIGVRGEIAVRRNGAAPAQRIVSVNDAAIAPLPAAGVRALREDLARSLNFRLPAAAVAAGQLTVELVALTSTQGATVPFAPATGRPVIFRETAPLRVKLIGLRYSAGDAPTAHEPTELDFQLTLSWLRRAYPVSEVLYTRVVLDSPDAWPFTCNEANAFLAEVRRQDLSAGGDARTHYFGLVSDAAGFMRGCASDVPDHPAPDTVASGPAGAADWNWDFDGSYADWYTGHEIGHTFGRAHPGFCEGNSSDDPAFPFADGQLCDADGAFVGFDIGDETLGLPMAVLPGQTWHDVMTYCERQWLCAYTYSGIRDRLMTEDTQFPPTGPAPAGPAPRAARAVMPPASQRLVHVVALVDLSAGTAKIRSVRPVERGTPSRETPDSPAIVEVLDSGETVLFSQRIRVKLSTCAEGDEQGKGMIDALIPAPESARQIRVLLEGREVDRFVAGAAAERSPQARRAAAVREAAVPSQEEGVRYIIQASRDGGATWETVATDRLEPRLQIERTTFPDVTRVLARAIETDGFTARVVRTEEVDLTQ